MITGKSDFVLTKRIVSFKNMTYKIWECWGNKNQFMSIRLYVIRLITKRYGLMKRSVKASKNINLKNIFKNGHLLMILMSQWRMNMESQKLRKFRFHVLIY